MPRPRTYPVLYDNVKTIDIGFLKRHGYLKPNHEQIGTLTWSRNGINTGSIRINSNTQSEEPYIELDYMSGKIPINYRIQLCQIHSNLGVGKIWFFICPRTRKRCRKLYSVGAYFYHRAAFSGCMYSCQTRGKLARTLDKYVNGEIRAEELNDKIHRKHFKKQYAGKPTKRYIRYSRLIEEGGWDALKQVQRMIIV